ncbi:DUF3857 domain-containing protein [Fulvivirgaceae bacterium BMA10]|uniref:DUF3857 domain-containing protein n=1 Tax=Splendidivirga corallicola TaxID=3051826 RepID=A0ABT8KTD4_9BACT|nr:DUF3857 domain-containing protein [Fulvivirgaceae bacterium BMA10]
MENLKAWVLTALLGSFFNVAQTTAQLATKFGKIDKEDLEMTVYEKDTSASAVVLFDYGTSYVTFNDVSGFQLIFQRHTKIKILNKEGYDWADGQIPIYHTNSNNEKVSKLRGYTYNLENGKIEKYKLEKKAIFNEKYDENWNRIKFTMPNVKEGSVIEYEYTINSDFYSQVRDWRFQQTIPILHSEYSIEIPEYFDFKQLMQGYVPLAVKDHETSAKTFSYTTKSRSTATGFSTPTRSTIRNNSINYTSHNYRWVAKDVPAFKSEKFMTTSEDYISKIEFELSSIKWPNEPVKPVLSTWKVIIKELLESESFGLQLKRRGFLKDKVAELIAGKTEDEEKAKAIYKYIQDHMKWNGKNRFLTNENLRKVYESGIGNSAEINLLLNVMLVEAGIDASPVVLSTRNNGKVQMLYPIINNFNYVITHFKVNDKDFLLDATNKHLPFNTLPYNCLNDQGKIIAKDNLDWIELRRKERYGNFIQVNLALNEDDEITGKIKSSCSGYEALELRAEIVDQGKEKYLEELEKENEDWIIENHEISNLDKLESPLNEEFEVTMSDYFTNTGNIIYIDPMLGENTKENPFKLEERSYPVDFGCPIQETYIMTLDIPEGYTVDELPQSAMIALPNKGGSFKYSVRTMGNKLTVTSTINIKQIIFKPEEYQYIKEFFNRVVTKQAEQIVLKKTT